MYVYSWKSSIDMASSSTSISSNSSKTITMITGADRDLSQPYLLSVPFWFLVSISLS